MRCRRSPTTKKKRREKRADNGFSSERYKKGAPAVPLSSPSTSSCRALFLSLSFSFFSSFPWKSALQQKGEGEEEEKRGWGWRGGDEGFLYFLLMTRDSPTHQEEHKLRYCAAMMQPLNLYPSNQRTTFSVTAYCAQSPSLASLASSSFILSLFFFCPFHRMSAGPCSDRWREKSCGGRSALVVRTGGKRGCPEQIALKYKTHMNRRNRNRMRGGKTIRFHAAADL